MNAIGATILVILIAVVLFSPRRWAMLGMIAGVLYLTQGQAIEALGLNLFGMRFLELAGFARVMIRREFSFSKLNEIDRLFIVFYSFTTVVFLVRSHEGQAYQVGLAMDAFLCYFTFRGLVGGIKDFRWFLDALVILLIPYLVLILLERLTSHNPFEFMGGITEGVYVRDEKVRCMGSFRHPSLLGTLGASFLPLYIALTFFKTKRLWAMVGFGVCLGIVVLSNSGGPLNFAVVAFAGWFLWLFRKKMFAVRSIAVCLVALLALVMKAPIWYLPAKISVFSGGDGWHRSYLVDIAVRNLGKWWLAGMPVSKTVDWFEYTLSVTSSADITNQFIAVGLTAGIMAIALYILLFATAFRNIGMKLETVRAISPNSSEAEFLLWGLGVMLCGHLVNFFGITYFDQTYVIWFMQLAAIANIVSNHRVSRSTKHRLHRRRSQFSSCQY